MTQIPELLKQVGVFMVCAQTILHFKPQQKYDKYLKLLVGIMVLAQLTMPIISAISGKEHPTDLNVDLYVENEAFDMGRMMGDADDILNKYMDIEIKSRLNNEQEGVKQ